jgi:hypothetical protein
MAPLHRAAEASPVVVERWDRACEKTFLMTTTTKKKKKKKKKKIAVLVIVVVVVRGFLPYRDHPILPTRV